MELRALRVINAMKLQNMKALDQLDREQQCLMDRRAMVIGRKMHDLKMLTNLETQASKRALTVQERIRLRRLRAGGHSRPTARDESVDGGQGNREASVSRLIIRPDDGGNEASGKGSPMRRNLL